MQHSPRNSVSNFFWDTLYVWERKYGSQLWKQNLTKKNRKIQAVGVKKCFLDYCNSNKRMYQDAHGAMYTSLMADGSLIHRLLSPVANRKERNLRLRVLSPLVNIFLKERKKPDASILLRSPLSLLQISKYKKRNLVLRSSLLLQRYFKREKNNNKKATW